MARKRVKVGTLIGTDERNDDETIVRTPRMKFGPGPSPAPLPTETTSPGVRPPEVPSNYSSRDSGEGDGGGNGPSGNSTPGSKDMSLAGLTEQAIAAVSTMDPSTAPPGMEKNIGMVSDLLGAIPSDYFNEPGEKPGLGMQAKSQASGTVAQAKGMIGQQEVEKKEPEQQDYAPPDPVATQEKPYNPQDYQTLAPSDTTGDDSSQNDTMGPSQDFSSNDMSDGGSGTDSGVGDGDGTGDGSGQGGGGSGAPGGSSDQGPGSWRKGVIDIQGGDPSREGEAIPGNTLHEGETVLTAAETKLLGDALLRKIKAAADDKSLTMAERRTRVRTLIAERN